MTRREHEQAILEEARTAWSTPRTNRAIIAALEASHTREDVIRIRLQRGYEVEGLSPGACDELISILDGNTPC